MNRTSRLRPELMPRSDDSADHPSLAPGSEPADGLTPDDVDALLACLADRRRRVLIDRLSEDAGPTTLEALVRHVSERAGGATARLPSDDAPVEIAIPLHHAHLPKLEEAGVVEMDDETNTVREGDHFDVATSVLEVV